MAELTIDQALQQGVEAHKAGQVQEADRLYTAILKAQPKHPDANHNMGVLAVGVGKVQEALPFFKTALEANSAMVQFWNSYIDTLIKLDKFTDARAVLDQAKSKGAKGDCIDKLEHRLNIPQNITTQDNSNTKILEKSQISILTTAIQLRENGEFNQAIDLLKNEINRFPQDVDLLALLSHCLLLEDQVEAAKFYLDKAKEIAPGNASVRWNTVRLMLKEQKILEALNVARDTSQRFPDDVEGMGVLGACFRANEEITDSLEVLNRAIELNPNYAEAFINRGLIRLSQENKPEALTDLEQAHRLKPHIKQIWDLVLRLHAEAKQYSEAILLLIKMIEIDPNYEKSFSLLAAFNQKADDSALAVKSFEKVLEVRPGMASMHLNLGIALNKQGEANTAIGHFKKALAIRPDHAEAYYNMGNALKAQGKLEEAIESYNKALAIKPDYVEAYSNMGVTLKDQGKLEEAIEAYNKALAIKPDHAEAYYNIGIALKGIEFQRPNPGLQKLIGSLLDQNNSVRPRDIARAAISLLKFEHNLQKHLQKPTIDKTGQSLQQTVTELSDLPLLLKLMRICPLADLGLETLLKKIRAKILLVLPSFESTSGALEFQSALALQCFTNEYIYDRSAEEEKASVALEASVEATLCKGEQPSPKAILCLASYKALHEYKWCNLLTDKSEIHRVFIRQFKEPNLEIDLKSSMLVLNEITDEISTKVQAQYEDNPYPRWVNLGLPIYPKPISIIVAKSKARLFDRAICDVGEPDILVAGCGTGQHSIGTAARFKGSKVLAIDLSLSSLAYAKRKTEELGVKNIEYMQADILKLTKLGKQFDIIESVGVLHHMDNPMAGWKVLTDCLRDGGLMGIGLYSELARQSVVEMREEISQLGIGSSDSEMKSLREMIVVSNEEQHKRLMSWSDFYSLSELRDLLFHIQEHRFTIPQLKQCLAELGLKFCGFENVAVVQDFRLSNIEPDDPYDLDKWQIYEASNPSAFAGMYQFWCQKVA